LAGSNIASAKAVRAPPSANKKPHTFPRERFLLDRYKIGRKYNGRYKNWLARLIVKQKQNKSKRFFTFKTFEHGDDVFVFISAGDITFIFLRPHVRMFFLADEHSKSAR